MQRENISDIIETYLKTILAQEAAVEIRRAEIARRFNCVPSQINYVIKTRFTPARGYTVESKRGGGGYIRIVKVKLTDDQDLIKSCASTFLVACGYAMHGICCRNCLVMGLFPNSPAI